MRVRQVTVLLACLGLALAEGQEEAKGFDFVAPVVGKSLFGEQVQMMAKEREEYAGNLAAMAGNLVIEKNASPGSLETAKRLLAVALQLSPRNRQALVVCFQLNKGLLPEKKKGDYTPAVMSRLLLTRARILAQEPTEESRLLASCFVEIAATIDPRNEDAVFDFEIQRLDQGDVNWERLYNAPKAPGQ